MSSGRCDSPKIWQTDGSLVRFLQSMVLKGDRIDAHVKLTSKPLSFLDRRLCTSGTGLRGSAASRPECDSIDSLENRDSSHFVRRRHVDSKQDISVVRTARRPPVMTKDGRESGLA